MSKRKPKRKSNRQKVGKKDFAKYATDEISTDEHSARSADLPVGVSLYTQKAATAGKNIGPAISTLTRIQAQAPSNPFAALKTYREHVPTLINWGMASNQLLHDVLKQNKQLKGATSIRNRKRWTEAEDIALIDQAAEDDTSLLELATTFGRSPQAVSSRLTYLVGINRVKQEIAGRITGYIDGEEVDGHFHGTLSTNDMYTGNSSRRTSEEKLLTANLAEEKTTDPTKEPIRSEEDPNS